MPKNVIEYHVQRYRPSFEAISKEVKLLRNHFSQDSKVRLHDLHLDGVFRMKFSNKVVSHHFIWYPFLAPLSNFNSRSNKINHIYTSLGDLPYLNTLNLKKTILTAAASCSIQKVQKRLPLLRRLKKIVVESELQKRQLLSLGINPEKIRVIYPPVDLKEFSFTPANGIFKILYASCPTRFVDFSKRGIYLLEQTAKILENVEFKLLWRKSAFKEVQQITRANTNMVVENEIIKDMNAKYAQVHCTIIPYTKFDNYLKLNPNSAIESLAAGKPILVSNKTEMAQFVKKEQCGVVFEPNEEGLKNAILEIKKNYHVYQKNCRKTAEKYFSKKKFLQEYNKIYNEISKI
jgi:glycosyltransferase involved in cell wall biosynthesis